MIDFELSKEQKELQQLARDFAQKEIAPHAVEFDRTGEFPRDICQKAWDLKLMNNSIPKEYGGMARSAVDEAIIAEEIAASCSGIGTALEANGLAEAPLILFGNDYHKRKNYMYGIKSLCSFGRRFRISSRCLFFILASFAWLKWMSAVKNDASFSFSPSPFMNKGKD